VTTSVEGPSGDATSAGDVRARPTARAGTATSRRRAVVLGGGGVLGFAWIVGALSALEVEANFEVRTADLLVGTSAGAIAAALLACGASVDEVRRHHQGTPAPRDPAIAYDYTTSSGMPPRPTWRLGSPRLLLGSVRHPRRSSAAVALSSMLPTGRGTLQAVRDMVTATAESAGVAGGWPSEPRLWIVATDYLSGTREVFGRDPAVSSAGHVFLADAVVASCAIPAWYPPVTIHGRPYIDGGTRSNTSLDLLLDEPADEVFVLAPMASVETDHPRSPVARVERAVRRGITRGLLSDAERLRARGTRVIVITPGPEDLAVMGPNLMNPRRRTEVLQLAMRTSAPQIRAALAARWQRRDVRAGDNHAAEGP
jgi:NTE family protein